jgi:hypothetical protein
MAAPAKHAHHLSVDIGPRPPASAAEATAAQYCSTVFEEARLETRVEHFKGLESFGRIYIPTTAAVLAGALLGTRRKARRRLGLALSVAGLAAFWGEQTSRWRPLTERMSDGPSQNVVAVLPALEEPRRRLVVVAHVDASRSGLMFHPRVAKDFRRSTLVGLANGLGSVGAWFLPRRLRRLVATAAVNALTNTLMLLIQREIWGKNVAGANDNASGTGVMLALAQTLALKPLRHTEVWFVGTGCEESDLVGMSAFMNRHGRDLEDAWFLNLDTVGGTGTTVSWITESSVLEALKADPHLVQLAEEVASEHPELGAEAGVWRTAGLDGDVAAVRGSRQMSIMALTPDGTLPNWHWPTDTYENLDEDVIDKCYQFAFELIRKFDRYA